MAFLQTQGRREPLLKAPASVLLLIAALALAHAARVWAPAATSELVLDNYAFVPLRYSPLALDPGTWLDRAIPFVSYMFLHADWTHLAINCLWLLAFGSVVARRFRPLLFLLFFLLCGAASAAIHLAFNWDSPAAVIGASGAISGLMAAGVRMLSVRGLADIEGRPQLLPILSPQVLAFSGFWVVINIVFGLTGVAFVGETHAIAWAAHLGGYFVGLFLAGPFDRMADARGPSETRTA